MVYFINTVIIIVITIVIINLFIITDPVDAPSKVLRTSSKHPIWPYLRTHPFGVQGTSQSDVPGTSRFDVPWTPQINLPAMFLVDVLRASLKRTSRDVLRRLQDRLFDVLEFQSLHLQVYICFNLCLRYIQNK